jgi:hypothetical protein
MADAHQFISTDRMRLYARLAHQMVGQYYTIKWLLGVGFYLSYLKDTV